jgi:ABC-type antimicrobial peptide transport system permease subunit
MLTLLGGFAICGLALAAVGVYGVMALFVTGRRREWGVRLALGASPAALARLVAREGGAALAVAIAAGGAGAWALTGYLATSLFQTTPTDVPAFLLATAVLAVVAAAALGVPLARVMRVDPAVVLRAE